MKVQSVEKLRVTANARRHRSSQVYHLLDRERRS